MSEDIQKYQTTTTPTPDDLDECGLTAEERRLFGLWDETFTPEQLAEPTSFLLRAVKVAYRLRTKCRGLAGERDGATFEQDTLAKETRNIEQIIDLLDEFGHPMDPERHLPPLADRVYQALAEVYGERDQLRADLAAITEQRDDLRGLVKKLQTAVRMYEVTDMMEEVAAGRMTEQEWRKWRTESANTEAAGMVDELTTLRQWQAEAREVFTLVQKDYDHWLPGLKVMTTYKRLRALLATTEQPGATPATEQGGSADE